MTLRELRKSKGLTAVEVAYFVGVSATTLFRWEDGTRSPLLTHVAKLATVLEVDLCEVARFLLQPDIGLDAVEAAAV